MAETVKTTSDNDIVTITPSAAAEVKRLMALEKKSDLYLRLAVMAGGCSGMSYAMEFDDEKREFDREFEYHGVKVLVDLKALRALSGTVLDYGSGLLGGGFQFNNPNAKRSCGCGTSFSC